MVTRAVLRDADDHEWLDGGDDRTVDVIADVGWRASVSSSEERVLDGDEARVVEPGGPGARGCCDPDDTHQTTAVSPGRRDPAPIIDRPP